MFDTFSYLAFRRTYMVHLNRRTTCYLAKKIVQGVDRELDGLCMD